MANDCEGVLKSLLPEREGMVDKILRWALIQWLSSHSDACVLYQSSSAGSTLDPSSLLMCTQGSRSNVSCI